MTELREWCQATNSGVLLRLHPDSMAGRGLGTSLGTSLVTRGERKNTIHTVLSTSPFGLFCASVHFDKRGARVRTELRRRMARMVEKSTRRQGVKGLRRGLKMSQATCPTPAGSEWARRAAGVTTETVGSQMGHRHAHPHTHGVFTSTHQAVTMLRVRQHVRCASVFGVHLQHPSMLGPDGRGSCDGAPKRTPNNPHPWCEV